jgi:hypothetical protein
MMRDDPIVDEVHKVRERLAASFNYDIAAIFTDIRSRESTAGDRLKNLQTSSKTAIRSSGGSAPSEIERTLATG